MSYPGRWVVERRLARDDERLTQTLAGLYGVAFVILTLKRFVALLWGLV